MFDVLHSTAEGCLLLSSVRHTAVLARSLNTVCVHAPSRLQRPSATSGVSLRYALGARVPRLRRAGCGLWAPQCFARCSSAQLAQAHDGVRAAGEPPLGRMGFAALGVVSAAFCFAVQYKLLSFHTESREQRAEHAHTHALSLTHTLSHLSIHVSNSQDRWFIIVPSVEESADIL